MELGEPRLESWRWVGDVSLESRMAIRNPWGQRWQLLVTTGQEKGQFGNPPRARVFCGSCWAIPWVIFASREGEQSRELAVISFPAGGVAMSPPLPVASRLWSQYHCTLAPQQPPTLTLAEPSVSSMVR